MAGYAIIENSIVVNTVVWDSDSTWIAPIGSTVVLIPYGIVAGIGYSYDVTNGFTAASLPQNQSMIANFFLNLRPINLLKIYVFIGFSK